MSRLIFDLQRAARALAKAPLFTSVAVLSLGLALALNTTMFALADAIFHPYVPYPHPEQIGEPALLGGDPKHAVSLDDRLAAVRGLHSYDRLATYRYLRAALIETGARSEYQWVAGVSPEFFDVLGVRPMLGRVFDSSEAGSRSTQGAVISFRFWNRAFSGRPLSDTLTMMIAHSRYTVIGIMPRGVHHPWAATDIWLPMDALPVDPSAVAFGPFSVMHFKPGVQLDAVRAELSVLAARLTAEYTPKRPLSARLWTLGRGYVSPSVFPAFVLGTVVMVLIIACANLGTMMIARGMARRRETAIRIALGASSRDVIREVLLECAIIGVAGVTLGVLLTWWALYLLPHFTLPSVPDLGDLEPIPSWRVFAFAVSATLATIVAAGALPAWRAARTDPAEPMKEGSATTTGKVRDRYNPLVMLEVALSTALLMCSALFVIVAVRLAAFDFRYAAKQLLTATIQPSVTGVPLGGESHFYDDLLARLTVMPRVRLAATRYWNVPEGRMLFSEEGQSGDRWMNSNSYAVVSPNYFRTLGINVVSGRDFAPGDAGGAMPIAILDEKAAEQLWPDTRNPIGRMIKLGTKESKAPWIRVVGVVQAIEYLPRKDIDLPPEPVVYVTVPNDTGRVRELLVRSDGIGQDADRAVLATSVQAELHRILPLQGDVPVRPWLDDYEGKRAKAGFLASLFGAFAGFGLVLCAVGLYGVLAYTVTRRLREFAVRIALGARRRDVIRIVVHDAAVTALAGVGIGAFGALVLTWPIVNGIGTIAYAPVVALIASESLLFLVAFVASLGPVRRAAQADPLEVIRAT